MNSKKKKKLVIFHCGFLYSGGGERIVLEEARGLIRRGYLVEVYAPNLDEEACFPEFIKEVGVMTLLPQLPKWFPFRDGLLMISSSILVPFFFWKFSDVDLFLGANQPGAWMAFLLAKILNRPYLVYLNQPNRLLYPRQIDRQTGWQTRQDYYLLAEIIKKLKRIIGYLDHLSITKAEAILVNGKYIGKRIDKIYRIKTVDAPAGSYYQDLAKLRLKPKEAFNGSFVVAGKKITRPYLLITNRHEPQKKFDYVIRAFKKVLEKYSSVSLVVPGPFTSYTSKLIDLARNLNIFVQIIYPGKISEPDLQKLYRNAAVYCYPSPDEDFGLGPLEAGGWGVPTVAWKHGGPTVTVDDGVTGFLAKPYEIGDYAAKILRLLADPALRAKMGKAAWSRTKNRFSWDKHLEVLEREMKRAFGNS